MTRPTPPPGADSRPRRRRHWAGPGAPSDRASYRAWSGSLVVLDGRWEEADRILRDLPNPGNACLRREITAAHAVLARHRGDPDRAWEEIRRLLPAGPETEPGDLIHQEGLFLQRLAADLCLDAGDVSTARAWLAAHDRWLAWSESVLGRAKGQVAWARSHKAAGDTARARAAAQPCPHPRRLAGPAPRPGRPSPRRDRDRGRPPTDGRGAPPAALDLATVCDAPFERALTLLVLAQLRLMTGVTNEAASLLNEVRDICGPIGAAPTLARVDALAARLTSEPSARRYPAGLTSREVDVLRLLPRGLSNAEIAEALFVSPRTIQSHLSNLYGKLGVGGRAGGNRVRHGSRHHLTDTNLALRMARRLRGDAEKVRADSFPKIRMSADVRRLFGDHP